MNTAIAVDTPESVGLSSAGLAAIDAKLQSYIDAGELAGVVTLVARHGRIVHTSALGKKSIAANEPAGLNDLFRIFSMTKPVTGVAMMILHDEGKWSPDDPISRRLPQFTTLQVFDGLDETGAVKTVPADHAPTMRELMSHTAGLTYGANPLDPLDKLYQDQKIWRSETLGEMAAKIGGLPLAYQPGSKWLYSLSMDIQGAVIEALSGQSLADFMRSRIFEPLGMVDTAFYTPPEKAARMSGIYRWTKDGGLVEVKNPLLRDYDAPPRLASGGGGLVSTLSDYAKFAQMILNGGELGGKRIVSAAALKLMMTNQISEAMLEQGFGVGQQQLRPGFGYAFDGAVFTDPDKAGVPVGKGTYHWDGAAGTWFWVDPTNDLLYVALIQKFAENGAPLQKITQTMMAGAIIGA